jgi:hypothetical protein
MGEAALLRVASCHSERTVPHSGGQVLRASLSRLRKAADRLSLRCSRGAPPSDHRAFCKAFGQRHEALAAEHDMGMLEAGIGEPEVIEPMLQRRPATVTPRVGHVGEVRQAEAPGSWIWRKITSCSSPWMARQGGCAAPASGGCPAQLGMPPQHLLEDGDGPEAGRRLQQRHDLGVENIRQRIGPPPRTAFFCDGSRGSFSIR